MKCETIPELEKFLAIQEQALGPDSPEVAITLSKLADLYFAARKFDKAENLYQRSLRIRENVTGPHRQDAEDARKNIDKVRGARQPSLSPSSERRPSQAPSATPAQPAPSATPAPPSIPAPPSPMKPQLPAPNAWQGGIRGSETYTSSFHPPAIENFSMGPCDSSINWAALSSTNLTSVGFLGHDPAGDNALHEAELEVSLMKQMVGSTHPSIADYLTKLADLYCRRKMYEEMEPLLIDALRIREMAWGAEDPRVTIELKNLAKLYCVQKRYGLAEPLYRRAIAIRIKALGDSHPKVADIEEQYARMLRKIHRISQAEELEKHITEIRTKRASNVQPF